MSDNQNLDDVICPCSGTTKAKIKNLVESGFDLDAISRKTGALTGCSGCEWEIAEFVKELTPPNQVE
jgi:NAD(P)H-nitrite reductase large subunit